YSLTAAPDPISHNYVEYMANKMNTPFMELGFSLARNVESKHPQSYWRNLLFDAPICYNPNIKAENVGPWNRANYHNLGYRPYTHGNHGYFPGLDYMLMYNFSRIK